MSELQAAFDIVDATVRAEIGLLSSEHQEAVARLAHVVNDAASKAAEAANAPSDVHVMARTVAGIVAVEAFILALERPADLLAAAERGQRREAGEQ